MEASWSGKWWRGRQCTCAESTEPFFAPRWAGVPQLGWPERLPCAGRPQPPSSLSLPSLSHHMLTQCTRHTNEFGHIQ